MPLRFRAVVPYTLPGVLALIGCWWYLSRKKQRSIRHENPEGAPPTATGLKASLAEGSNGLLESTASPTHVPSKGADQRAEDGEISQKIKAEQSSEGEPADRRVGIVSQEDGLQANRRPACCSASSELHVNDARAAEEDLLVVQDRKSVV